jgi:hypothetical protein
MKVVVTRKRYCSILEMPYQGYHNVLVKNNYQKPTNPGITMKKIIIKA